MNSLEREVLRFIDKNKVISKPIIKAFEQGYEKGYDKQKKPTECINSVIAHCQRQKDSEEVSMFHAQTKGQTTYHQELIVKYGDLIKKLTDILKELQ